MAAFNWIGDWIETDGASAGPGDGNVTISGGTLLLDDWPDSGGQPSASRAVNLIGASDATLSFDFLLGPSVDLGSDIAVLEVSTDNGVSWTILENFSTLSGGAGGSLNYDLNAFTSAQTLIRFRITAGYSKNKEYLSIDNVSVIICGALAPPPPPPPPLICNGNYRDEFNGLSYAGSDGSLDWSTAAW